MQSNLTRALPLLLCLWLPGALLAQTGATEEPEQTEAVKTEDKAGEQPAPASDPVSDNGEDSGENAERSPHDYRPSEDISEDLSVSFPVDI